jgi:hypothetical protein
MECPPLNPAIQRQKNKLQPAAADWSLVFLSQMIVPHID